MIDLVWPILRPALPYLAAVLALYGAYWYVDGLRSDVATLTAERDDALQQARTAQDQIGARIRAQRQNEENERETIRRLASARAAAADTAGRLRQYRQAPAVPAADPAGRQPDATGSGEPAGCGAEPARAAEVDAACAAVSAERSAFAAELIRIDRALRGGN